ncbi:hypothetical protein L916_16138 [Phytophthora nicotianae]|uniref:Uncharacterized protein n=1 Tax=Phytophthora nicotianae TaxID=4792 RepID=W2IA27_PHYNI|nr:hypothetical protein L916_16138 [Phytophthora nicotianae]
MAEHLIDGFVRDVHASRLKLYADSSFNVTEEIREHISNQDISLTGMEDIENSWEPILTLHEDVKLKLQNYVAKATDAKLSSYLQQLDKLYLPLLSEAASNCGNTFASLLSTTRSTEQPPPT